MLSARISEARARYYAAEAELAACCMTAAVTTRRLYAELQYLEADMRSLDAIADVRKALLDQLQGLAGQGVGTIVDASRAAARYLDALSDRQRCEADRDRLLAELAAWAGVLPSTIRNVDNEPVDGLPELPDGNNLADLEESAMQRRADLARAGWETLAAKAAYREARSTRIPWFTYLQGRLQTREDSGSSLRTNQETSTDGTIVTTTETSEDSGDLTNWELSAGISLPIFSWYNREIDVRKAEWRQAQAMEAQAIESMRRRIRQCVDAVRNVDARLTAFTRQSTPALDELRRVIEDPATLAALPPDEAARLREQVLEVERLRQANSFERVSALLDLEEAIGSAPVTRLR
jgi:outer membrane protein TolC